MMGLRDKVPRSADLDPKLLTSKIVEDFEKRQGQLGHECISQVFQGLRQNEYYLRNAAYDHFWVAGIQHPFNPCTQLQCQLEVLDPFARNMMFLAACAGLWFL